MWLLVSLFIILAYISVVLYKGGIPHSLSETYYILGNKLWFSFSLILASIFLVPSISFIPNLIQFLMFLSISGIIFVGCTPDIRLEWICSIHTWSASLSLICSLILVGVLNPYLLLVWGTLLPYIVKECKKYGIKEILEKSNLKFWAEMIMLITIYITLFLLL